MKAPQILVLVAAIPLLLSAQSQPQGWGIVMVDSWLPSGGATFKSRENSSEDEMNVTLRWDKMFPENKEDFVFKRYDSYEFNLGLYKDAKRLYKGCVVRGRMPEFYDDCDTAGVSEMTGNSFAFGTYSTKNIPRGTVLAFTIVMKKNPAWLHGVKRGEVLTMNLYSEAVKCLGRDPWLCGLNPNDHVIHHHATQAQLANSLSVYGVGGSYSWTGARYVEAY